MKLEQPPDFEEVHLAAREKRLTARIPLGRLVRFEEPAPMMVFLAFDEASYITGGMFVMDGSLTVI